MKYPEDFINKVIQGDCLRVMKEMPDKCVDLVLTDPPYGIKADENPIRAKFIYDKTSWDRERPSKEIFDEIFRIINQIIWGGNYFTDYLPLSMGWLVWDKILREFSLADGEMAWTNFDNAMRIFSQNRSFKFKDGFHHPTQKSVELMGWCIKYADKNAKMDNFTILDPFLGSGTTAVACKQLKRNFIGIEISPEYCKIAEERLRQDIML